MRSGTEADLAHFLGLKYPVEMTEQDEGGYFIRIPDLGLAHVGPFRTENGAFF